MNTYRSSLFCRSLVRVVIGVRKNGGLSMRSKGLGFGIVIVMGYVKSGAYKCGAGPSDLKSTSTFLKVTSRNSNRGT